ncbi:MAG: M23 family metallopeptidase [Deltaproteobacteria bacterium]|nr:M23 family metallopeptidase [Deltaproteobacteria bacterium]
MDLDDTTVARDYNCGAHTYDAHAGTDFALFGGFSAQNEGQVVVAAAPGQVVEVHDGDDDRCTTGACGGGNGLGNFVALAHANGQRSLYGHMRRGSITLRVGDRVACGAAVGLVGSSGNSTGPHLHFEVREGDRVIDPFAARTGCGSSPGYWQAQGSYRALPSEQCDPDFDLDASSGSDASMTSVRDAGLDVQDDNNHDASEGGSEPDSSTLRGCACAARGRSQGRRDAMGVVAAGVLGLLCSVKRRFNRGDLRSSESP